jgi:hypothetical protein
MKWLNTVIKDGIGEAGMKARLCKYKLRQTGRKNNAKT